eukprot:3596990-Rhodomonas_salina.1
MEVMLLAFRELSSPNLRPCSGAYNSTATANVRAAKQNARSHQYNLLRLARLGGGSSTEPSTGCGAQY